MLETHQKGEVSSWQHNGADNDGSTCVLDELTWEGSMNWGKLM